MEVELDTAQELVWRFTTKLGTGESSCNLCGVTFQTNVSSTSDINNHILQEHGTTEEVFELKQFIKNSTNFVTIKNGRKDLLSGSPTTNEKEPEGFISPVWKFATKMNNEDISCNLCGIILKIQAKRMATQVKEHIMKEHGNTEAGIELNQYFAHKAKLSFVNKLPKVQSCKKENKHCKCCAKFVLEEVCDECGFKTNDPRSLKNHRKTHINTVCEECGFQTEHWKMQYHIKTSHKEKPITIVKCDHCDYKAKRGNVKIHMRNVHEGFRINCEQCDRKFTQFSELNNHLIKVHGVQVNKTLECGECNFSTTIRQLMTGHKKKKHEDGSNKKHFCHNCKTSFRGESNLATHWKSPGISCSAELNKNFN